MPARKPIQPRRNLRQKIQALKRHKAKVLSLIPKKGTKRTLAPFKGMTAKDIIDHQSVIRIGLFFEDVLKHSGITLSKEKQKEAQKTFIEIWRTITRLENKYGNLATMAAEKIKTDPDATKMHKLRAKLISILGPITGNLMENAGLFDNEVIKQINKE